MGKIRVYDDMKKLGDYLKKNPDISRQLPDLSKEDIAQIYKDASCDVLYEQYQISLDSVAVKEKINEFQRKMYNLRREIITLALDTLSAVVNTLNSVFFAVENEYAFVVHPMVGTFACTFPDKVLWNVGYMLPCFDDDKDFIKLVLCEEGFHWIFDHHDRGSHLLKSTSGITGDILDIASDLSMFPIKRDIAGRDYKEYIGDRDIPSTYGFDEGLSFERYALLLRDLNRNQGDSSEQSDESQKVDNSDKSDADEGIGDTSEGNRSEEIDASQEGDSSQDNDQPGNGSQDGDSSEEGGSSQEGGDSQQGDNSQGGSSQDDNSEGGDSSGEGDSSQEVSDNSVSQGSSGMGGKDSKSKGKDKSGKGGGDSSSDNSDEDDSDEGEENNSPYDVPDKQLNKDHVKELSEEARSALLGKRQGTVVLIVPEKKGHDKDDDKGDNNKKGNKNVESIKAVSSQALTRLMETLKDRGIGSASIEELLPRVKVKRMNWRAIIQDLFVRMKRELSWAKPDKRMYVQGINIPSEFTVPSLSHLVISFDQSGSMSNEECAAAAQWTIDLAKRFNFQKITLIIHDHDIVSIEEVENEVDYDFESKMMIRKAAGGTSHVPVINWIADNQKEYPPICIYISFTDGYSEFDGLEKIDKSIKIAWIISKNDGFTIDRGIVVHTDILWENATV